MNKPLKNKIILAFISTLIVMLVVMVIVLTKGKYFVPSDQNQEKSKTTSDIDIMISTPAETKQSENGNTSDNTGTDIFVEPGTDITNILNPSTVEGSVETDIKPPPQTDFNVSVGTGSNDNEPEMPQSSLHGVVVEVEPVERGDEPGGASGFNPIDSDWVSINNNIPYELYQYDYTKIEGNDIITGVQMEWRGYRDWEKAANAAIGGLTQYYTVDYRKIMSTNPNDKDKYLTDLVFWTGESAHMDICDYMQFILDNKIISTGSVVTDGSLMYNNGIQLIRARIYVVFENGASAYGLQDGIKYYRDVEVAVYPATGEDRYGFGQCNDFNVLLFSENCFIFLCEMRNS